MTCATECLWGKRRKGLANTYQKRKIQKSQGESRKTHWFRKLGVAECFLCPQSWAAANGSRHHRPRGELHASDARIQTPRDSGTIHVSFLDQCGRASPKLCHTYISERTQMLDLKYFRCYSGRIFPPEFVKTKFNLWGQSHLPMRDLGTEPGVFQGSIKMPEKKFYLV